MDAMRATAEWPILASSTSLIDNANLHKILRILHQFDKKVETTAHFLSESKC